MCDDLVQEGDGRRCREYPIEIVFCDRCVTAHQRYSVPKKELFPDSYHYRSRFTADVLNGMQALVASCEASSGSLAGKTVLDVGCNDGSLLGFFRTRGAVTVGIEPTGAFRDAEASGHRTFNAFLTPALADEVVSAVGHPDVITFTNVFAHIENLREVLESLRRLMSPKTIVLIENHYLGAILERHQFDTFYHEHPRTYSYTSFLHVAKALGTKVLSVEFPLRYGGNIRVALGPETHESAPGAVDTRALMERESHFGAELKGLQHSIESWCQRTKRQLAAIVAESGPIRAKAFPGRAAILIKLLGVDEKTIEAVFEKPGSLKIGHYLPGTRIPIRSDEDLLMSGDLTRPILNLAWHIPDEIRAYLRAHGYTGQVIDIFSPEAFTTAG
jgi:hypothetical protein